MKNFKLSLFYNLQAFIQSSNFDRKIYLLFISLALTNQLNEISGPATYRLFPPCHDEGVYSKAFKQQKKYVPRLILNLLLHIRCLLICAVSEWDRFPVKPALLVS